MLPIELEVTNFLAYRDTVVLSFDGIHVAGLTGPNGAGKSSLLDALTWALWGKARSTSADDLIHHGQQEMRVMMVFQQDDCRYRVIRQRKAGKRGHSLLELQQWDASTESWQGISAATIRETQQLIEETLRLDYETFVNSALLLQGRADEFTTRTPGQRKDVLASILGLEQWARYEERARRELLSLKSSLIRLEARIEDVSAELARRSSFERDLVQAEERAIQIGNQLDEAEQAWKTSDEIRTRRDGLMLREAEVDKRLHETQDVLSQQDATLDELRSRDDAAALEAAAAKASEELDTLEDTRRRFTAVADRKRAFEQERAHLSGVNKALGPEAEPIKDRIRTLQQTTEPACPTCGQPLTDVHRKQVLARLESEVDTRRHQYRKNRAQITSLDNEIQVLVEEQKALEAALSLQTGLEKRAGELDAALQHIGDVEQLIKQAEEQAERLRTSLHDDQQLKMQLTQEREAAEGLLRGTTHSKDELDRLRLEKRLADERVGGARQQLAALDTMGVQLEEWVKEQQAQEEEQSLFEVLRVAFSKRGLPAMMIESAVPELEQEANSLLRGMTDGRMDIRIETQREIQSGEMREALDIIISDELGSRPYETFSGGEAFRINFALRIALSKLLAKRAGAQLRTLFIDEGFGTQDENGRAHLIAAIQAIQSDFDRIIVITHIDELKDAFPTRIEVEKSAHGSQLRIS